MKKYFLYFIVFTCLILCYACVKHKTVPCVECEAPILDFDTEDYFVYIMDGNYKTPCFNPNNSDEIIYQGITSDEVPCLIKYNMATQEKSTVFCSEVMLHRPRWSKKDWIIFDKIDNNIYKIKSNGDSLTQLTFAGDAFSPEWDIKGERFVYADISTPGVRSTVCDEDGNFLFFYQSGLIGYYCWQHDSTMIGGFTENGLLALNFFPTELVAGLEYEKNTAFLGEPQWVGNESFVWSTYEGVYKFNTVNWDDIPEWKGEKIIDACGFTRYNEPTYSYESNKLIFHKHEERELEPGKVLLKHSLVIMNPDGTDEQEIIIPE